MSLVTVSRHGGAAVLTYANPPFGTMTAVGAGQMYAAVKAAAEDDSVRCIILTGGLPGIFIRHYDVSELSDLSDALTEPRRPQAPDAPREPGFGELVDLLVAAPKPVIAAINGHCMGGGFEISLHCDLRIASPQVQAIGLPETRIGIFPGGGGTQILPRIIGEAKALEIILRGLTFDGEQAHAIGMVHELADDPLARALEIADEFARRPAEGIAQAKRLTRAALDRPLDEGQADERRTFLSVIQAPSAREALRGARTPVLIQEV
jgi:enoyl-CoA hydratase